MEWILAVAVLAVIATVIVGHVSPQQRWLGRRAAGNHGGADLAYVDAGTDAGGGHHGASDCDSGGGGDGGGCDGGGGGGD